ncbi:MAG TPA: di-heme-cytochrome C peroxidase [Bryobacteraceae bacterium]|nr:di-heme-cytochrome C peroxidase [Bryobacteraceae bacterium]
MPSRRQAVAVFVGALVAAGCSQKPPAPAPTELESPLSFSGNGWTPAEWAEYYHLPEGSELMPYSLLANLKSIKTGKPFLEDMERFGFLQDRASTANPYGMPVGLTVARSRDASSEGVEMVGFNCAACHVGEITWKGKRLRLHGAPGLINLQGYQVEFRDSLNDTLKNPKKLLALVIAMEKKQTPDTPSEEAASQYLNDEAVKTAGDVQPKPTADPDYASKPSKEADALRPEAAKLPFAQRLKLDIALLKARLAYIEHGRLILDGTEPGPGRVDAFGAARNFLFPKYAMKMQSPVSFPYIWSVPDNTREKWTAKSTGWIHYDGNTNSILERNIGQALGMGAVFDPKTYQSSLRIVNLHRLEELTRQLKPPRWPEELLGPIDAAKAEAGKKIFEEKCQGCHRDQLVSLVDVGTDPNRANSFGRPVDKTPFPAAVAPILKALKERAFQDEGISKEEQVGMDVNPAIWRATGKYMARTLWGIWATAPYLHNASVPTLYHLLHPDQRPQKFLVGNREFDPEKVGYQTTASGPDVWEFDTSQPGNSNIGHAGERFGTTLPEEQKAALLEYLKTL